MSCYIAESDLNQQGIKMHKIDMRRPGRRQDSVLVSHVIADNLKTLASSPDADQTITLTALQLRDIIQEVIAPITQEVRDLNGDIKTLRSFCEVHLGTIPGADEKDRADHLDAYARRRKRINELPFEFHCLENRINDLLMPAIDRHEKILCELKVSSPSSGKVTQERIAEVTRLLKASPEGSLSFKTLRSKMGLQPNQFTRVINALDKRKFEVFSKAHSSKEKCLRIKVRWS